MTAWRQAVFIRQRRLDVIQRALTKVLDEESWSPATPRRLHVGAADASSHGWTMIVSPLADFFLDDGGAGAPRLARLADELRCPAFALDVRGPDVALVEADGRGQVSATGTLARGSGPAIGRARELARDPAIAFALIAMPAEAAARIAGLAGTALADYVGALVGFPAWTRHADDPIAAGALVYEPRVGSLRARPETRAASARTPPRAAPPAHDRTGTRPRSAARPRR
jgi:hypothetical protein